VRKRGRGGLNAASFLSIWSMTGARPRAQPIVPMPRGSQHRCRSVFPSRLMARRAGGCQNAPKPNVFWVWARRRKGAREQCLASCGTVARKVASRKDVSGSSERLSRSSQVWKASRRNEYRRSKGKIRKKLTYKITSPGCTFNQTLPPPGSFPCNYPHLCSNGASAYDAEGYPLFASCHTWDTSFP
jgi:hypothetical protein